MYVPSIMSSAVAEDGFIFPTVQVYSPLSLPLTVRVWTYSAVVVLATTLWVPSVILTESLVQVTVVAGPPVEIQVRVN